VGERFLVIQLRQIGDVVLTTPIPHILKAERPGCRVVFLTEAPSHLLLEGNPHIDRVVVGDRKGGWREMLRVARELRREGFDAVLDFMGNPRSAVLAFLSGARVRISYPVQGRGILYTHRVRPSGWAVEHKKALLRPLGIQSAWDRPEIFLSSAEKQWAQARRQEWLGGRFRRLVTVDPSHRRPLRRWPAPHYGALCRMMQEHLLAVPLVLRGPGEEAVADEVVAASGGRAVKSPPTTLREMAALVSAADLHVGNCSAPRHVAVGVGVPSFTIMGATNAGWTHPAQEHTHLALGLECQPCNFKTCPKDLACLTGLTPDRVFQELESWTRSTLGWSAA
jgi:ADP-heptose:LPS heptosyltransferase